MLTAFEPDHLDGFLSFKLVWLLYLLLQQWPVIKSLMLSLFTFLPLFLRTILICMFCLVIVCHICSVRVQHVTVSPDCSIPCKVFYHTWPWDLLWVKCVFYFTVTQYCKYSGLSFRSGSHSVTCRRPFCPFCWIKDNSFKNRFYPIKLYPCTNVLLESKVC